MSRASHTPRKAHHAYSKLIVLQNRSATHSKRIARYIEELEAMLGLTAELIDITDYRAEKVHSITSEVVDKLSSKDKTLLCVGGGDGTASSVIHGVVTTHAAQKLGDRLVLLPLWGGNANDLATMLNGLINTVSLPKIVAHATTAEIFPLKLEFEPKAGEAFTKIATSYASFGATAHASWYMERSSHARDGTAPKSFVARVSKEVIDFWRAVIQLEGFGIETEESKVISHTYERLFINGSRIARIPNTAVKLTEKKYLEASAPKKHFYLALYAYKAFFRQKHGTVTGEPTTFTVKNATMAQIDGEIIGLEADTRVTVSINTVPFFALSRKL